MKAIKITFNGLHAERRKTQRLNIPLRTQYRIVPRGGKKDKLREGFTHDISGGGLGLCTDFPLNKGDKMEIAIHFPSDPKPVNVVSEIMWCKKISKNGEKPSFAVGMQYVKINPRDKERFILLFCEMMLEHFVLGDKSRPKNEIRREHEFVTVG